MDRDALAGMLDIRDGCNDITVSLAPGAIQSEIIRQLDLVLSGYGGLGAIGRADQLSHQFITNELAQTRMSTIVLSAIFLSVTAFLIHNVLLRLTALQRAQIGLLKSFGYSNLRVGLHFLQFVIATVVIGAVASMVLGTWLGAGLAHLYARFFHFPSLHFSLSPQIMLIALSLAIAAAGIGAALAVQRVWRLTPAESMRPDSPSHYRAGWLEKSGLQRLLPLALRMVLRNLVSSPIKTMLTVLGLSLSGALIING